MSKYVYLILLLWTITSCVKKEIPVSPQRTAIASFVYASGVIKSKNQYTVYPTVSGTVEQLMVSEGDTVRKSTLLLTITNEIAQLNRNNASLTAENASLQNNRAKLDELQLAKNAAFEKYKLDSLLFIRQKQLRDQQIGSELDYEQRQLNFTNSRSSYFTAINRYDDFVRQVKFNAAQSQNALQISTKQASDFEVKSDIDGRVYVLYKRKGDLVSPQTPIAVIGDARSFIIEMQVDEFDITKVSIGKLVYVHMDSYKDKVYMARISKIIPIMNERTKSFTVEAEFVEAPQVLYPNLTVEANILIEEIKDALVIPAIYITDSEYVKTLNGEWIKVITGIKNLEKVQILSGIDSNTQLIKP